MPHELRDVVVDFAKKHATRPRIISDNGQQLGAGEFKDFIRHAGMTHVRSSPYYPQSNGKLERWHYIVKGEAIRLYFLGWFALNQNGVSYWVHLPRSSCAP